MTEAAIERLHRDLHPAECSLPDGRVLRDVRVFVTSSRLLAFQANAGKIEPLLDLTLEQPCSVPRSRGSLVGALEVRLADGGTVWVNRGSGCGCGSPLLALSAPVGW